MINIPKLSSFLPKSANKCIQIQETVSSEHFRRQSAPVSSGEAVLFWRLFGRNGRSKDQFWDPRKIKDLRKMVRRFVGLRFFGGIAGFVMWNFVKGNVKSFMLKRHQNFEKQHQTSIKSSQILPKSIKNGTKIDEHLSFERFRCQIAPRWAPGRAVAIAGEPFDCGVAGLRFVDLMYFLASWGCGLAFFVKKT